MAVWKDECRGVGRGELRLTRMRLTTLMMLQIWSALGPLAEKVMSGTSITRDDEEFLLETREGKQLEEYYHSCE